jgi:hypothetical protein
MDKSGVRRLSSNSDQFRLTLLVNWRSIALFRLLQRQSQEPREAIKYNEKFKIHGK